MTNLIYRSIRHTGAKAVAPRTTQALTYRGVAHDGVASQASQPTRITRMCYRGIHYVAGQAGFAQVASAPPSTSITSAATA